MEWEVQLHSEAAPLQLQGSCVDSCKAASLRFATVVEGHTWREVWSWKDGGHLGPD